MEKEQLEKMQWGRRAKAIKAVNPDYNCEGKSEEDDENKIAPQCVNDAEGENV